MFERIIASESRRPANPTPVGRRFLAEIQSYRDHTGEIAVPLEVQQTMWESANIIPGQPKICQFYQDGQCLFGNELALASFATSSSLLRGRLFCRANLYSQLETAEYQQECDQYLPEEKLPFTL